MRRTESYCERLGPHLKTGIFIWVTHWGNSLFFCHNIRHWSKLKNWLAWRKGPLLFYGKEDKYPHILLAWGWWSLVLFQSCYWMAWMLNKAEILMEKNWMGSSNKYDCTQMRTYSSHITKVNFLGLYWRTRAPRNCIHLYFFYPSKNQKMEFMSIYTGSNKTRLYQSGTKSLWGHSSSTPGGRILNTKLLFTNLLFNSDQCNNRKKSFLGVTKVDVPGIKRDSCPSI